MLFVYFDEKKQVLTEFDKWVEENLLPNLAKNQIKLWTNVQVILLMKNG